MTNAILNVPEPKNEPVYDYAPGSPERAGAPGYHPRHAGAGDRNSRSS